MHATRDRKHQQPRRVQCNQILEQFTAEARRGHIRRTVRRRLFSSAWKRDTFLVSFYSLFYQFIFYQTKKKPPNFVDASLV